MIKRITTSALLSSVLLLAACSTTPTAAPTKYRSASSESAYGYSSEKVSDSEYKVLFKATDKTPEDDVQQYVLRRAAEIAEENGFQYLAITKTDIEKKPTLARSVNTETEKPVPFQTQRQCTMSGCSEVAQPMAGTGQNVVEKTRINNVYYSITVKAANTSDALNGNAISVQEILSTPLPKS